MSPAASKEELEAAFLGAVAAADPTKLVKAHIRTGALDDWFKDREDPEWINVVAIGKAAPRMLWGLVEANVPFRGIGVAPHGIRLTQVDTFRWLRGEHPVPGPDAHAAGQAVMDWIESAPDGPILALLSGGGSSICEATALPREEHAARWRRLLGEGLDITRMNQARAEMSVAKGGGLARLAEAHGHEVRVLVLSDVPAGAERLVASGPFDRPGVRHTVIGDRSLAVQGAAQAVAAAGFQPFRHGGDIDGPVDASVSAFLSDAADVPADGVLIGAGEPTVAVPQDAPPGGRAQHAALFAAKALSGGDGRFLAAGTDGIDGTTREAGAVVDGGTWQPDADESLKAFDAHGYLDRAGATIRIGHTGTNVNDVWLAAGL